MSAMNIDLPAVRALFDLVDEHKDELKESDYIKICNGMKILFQKCNETPAPAPTNRPYYVTNSIMLNSWRLLLQNLRNKLMYFENNNGRVNQNDKVVVLNDLFQSHSLQVPQDVQSTYAHIKCMEFMIRDRKCVNLTTLKTLYQNQRDIRRSEEKQVLINKISHREQLIARMELLCSQGLGEQIFNALNFQ